MGTSPQDSVPRVHVLPLKGKDDFIGFWQWLSPSTGIKSKPVGWLSFLSIFLPIVGMLLGITYQVIDITKKGAIHLPFGPPTLEGTLKVSYLAQIVVIFALLLRLAFVEMPYDERFGYGNKGQERIRLWWSIALFSFLLFYICQWTQTDITSRLAESGIRAEQKASYEMAISVLRVMSNLCNNGSTLAFLMCFSAMEWPAKDRSNKLDGWVLCWVGCLMMLTFIQVAFRDQTTGQINWFDLLAGANAGIALAMFCGRLSTPLINPPLLVTALLYLYAVLQISFGFWGEHKIITLVMATLCLFLKVLLALVITWMLSTRHLMFYMERMNLLRPQLDEWRKELRERRGWSRRPAKAS